MTAESWCANCDDYADELTLRNFTSREQGGGILGGLFRAPRLRLNNGSVACYRMESE